MFSLLVQITMYAFLSLAVPIHSIAGEVEPSSEPGLNPVVDEIPQRCASFLSGDIRSLFDLQIEKMVRGQYSKARGQAEGYHDFIYKDPYGGVVRQALRRIKSISHECDVDELYVALLVVQGVPYEGEHIDRRFPSETLGLWGGDCSDKSVLFSALLNEMGYRHVLLIFEREKHMAVGVLSSITPLEYIAETTHKYTIDDEEYFFTEMTSTGFLFGEPASQDFLDVIALDPKKEALRYEVFEDSTVIKVENRTPSELEITGCLFRDDVVLRYPPFGVTNYTRGAGLYKIDVPCNIGDKVCFGAREVGSSSYYGIDSDCSASCKGCCLSCGKEKEWRLN